MYIHYNIKEKDHSKLNGLGQMSQILVTYPIIFRTLLRLLKKPDYDRNYSCLLYTSDAADDTINV